MKKPVYITTTLPYVNAEPHLGFAGEMVKADFLNRFYKKLDYDVFFNTGTDEHGQKIYDNASTQNINVQDYVNKLSLKFKDLILLLDLDKEINFIRTTDQKHISSAQLFWQKCQADISKKTYQAKYCIGCELEKTDSDLDQNGECPLHPGKPIQLVDEENYFFNFSRFQPILLEKFKNKEIQVFPEFRHQEMITFLENGLQDFSISRLKTKMPWGIPVLGDDDHVMYVWFDALVNYISTLDWPNENSNYTKFWQNGLKIQLAGKDNLRQQSLMWQSMLLSAGLPTTDQIYIGGFINAEGNVKMSKSLGNVISPSQAIDWFKDSAKYPSEVIRYFLLRHLHSFDDTAVSENIIKESYTAHLVKGLGNTVSRLLAMCEKNDLASEENFLTFYHQAENAFKNQVNFGNIDFSLYFKYIFEFRFDLALDFIFQELQKIDQAITEDEPFKVTDQKKLADLFWNENSGYFSRLIFLIVFLEPAMPKTATKILNLLKTGKRDDKNIFNWLPK